MRILSAFVLACVGLIAFAAAARAQTLSPAGVLVLQTVAGSPGGAVAFNSIIWTGTSGGVATDAAGNHTLFTNQAIGRILYFDQAYYEEIDHNQNWQDWRAGLQSRETVVAPIDTVSLHPDDVPTLQGDEKMFQDVLARFPSSQPVLGPMIATIQQDIGNIAAGEVLENGKWIPASQAGSTQAPVATVGDSGSLATFTTRDGKTFTDAKIVLTDTGISVVTANGGGSVSFEQLPDDLSPFPANVRDKIRSMRAKHNADLAEASKPPPTWLDTANSWWETARDFCTGLYAKFFGGSSTTTSGGNTSTNAAPAASVAPASPADIQAGLVQIKGDNAQGTGFLLNLADGPVIVTAIHLIAENPNAKFFLSTGDQIFPTGLRCANDRDIAEFMIQDNSFHYLDLAADFTAPKAGDPAIIPGDASAEGSGELLSVGLQHIQFTNPVRKAATAGAPIIDGKINKVLAVLAGPDFGSAPSSPSEMIGLRIDNVPQWEPYNEFQFVSETMFLKGFHAQTRALDSFVNGLGIGHQTISRPDGPLDAKYYLGNDKLTALAAQFSITPNPASPPAANPDLLAALKQLADDDRAKLSNPGTYYNYNQARIKTEIAYRDAIAAEINDLVGASSPSAPTSSAATTVQPPMLPAPDTSAAPTNATPPAPAESSTMPAPAPPAPAPDTNTAPTNAAPPAPAETSTMPAPAPASPGPMPPPAQSGTVAP
jgi:hypothetical protein